MELVVTVLVRADGMGVLTVNNNLKFKNLVFLEG